MQTCTRHKATCARPVKHMQQLATKHAVNCCRSSANMTGKERLTNPTTTLSATPTGPNPTQPHAPQGARASKQAACHASRALAPGAAAEQTGRSPKGKPRSKSLTRDTHPHRPGPLAPHTAASRRYNCCSLPSSSSSSSSSTAKTETPCGGLPARARKMAGPIPGFVVAPTPLLLSTAAAVPPLTVTEEASTASSRYNVKPNTCIERWPLRKPTARPALAAPNTRWQQHNPSSPRRGSARPARPTLEQSRK